MIRFEDHGKDEEKLHAVRRSSRKLIEKVHADFREINLDQFGTKV
jgi:hypothetical protein